MKHRVYLLVLIAVAFLAATARADLGADVRAVTQDKLLRKAQVGVAIARLGPTLADAQVIFQQNGDALLIPASNLKVVTTSAALDHFGADFRFQTLLLLHHGDLIMVGDGDPTLGDTELLKQTGWDETTVFHRWAQQLRKMKVTTVNNVTVDDSVFDEEFLHPRWKDFQFEKYGSEIGGVNLNLSCLEYVIHPTTGGQSAAFSTVPATHYLSVQNGSVTGSRNDFDWRRKAGTNQVVLSGHVASVSAGLLTIHDPPMFAATVLADTLTAEGIRVTGQIQRDRTLRQQYQANSPEWTVVGIHQTSLSVVLGRANKNSKNQYAECLCKRLGASVSGTSGSWANGTAAVGEFLKKAGVDPTRFKLDDGSGLSKANAITPNAMIRVLIYDHYARNWQAFLDSLAVGGSDGTLEKRFAGELCGRVFAKTGFVEGVSALSGYLHAKDGQWYAFSILMNGIPHQSNSSIKPLQERIVRALDQMPNLRMQLPN